MQYPAININITFLTQVAGTDEIVSNAALSSDHLNLEGWRLLAKAIFMGIDSTWSNAK